VSADFIVITTAILVAVPCALLGTLLVLRQMAMIGDAISHAVLPGIVFAFFISESLGALTSLIGAAVFGLLCAVLIEALKNTGRVKEDSSIGIVFTALFALGVFLISRFAGSVHLDLQHVLYGEIAFSPLNSLIIGGVNLGPISFWTLGVVTVIAVSFVLLFYKELKIATFDAGLAAAVGLSPVLVHYLLMGAVSITVVGAFDSVGAILVVAFLIAPAATAYLLTEQLWRMMALAVALGTLSAVSGYYFAAFLDVSISGMMATMTGFLFILALLFSPSHGLAAAFSRRRENRRIFSRDLLLSRIGTLGEKTTEEELARSLGWERRKISRSLDEALRGGFIVRPSSGEVAATRKGRDAARERAGSLA
jgi:manganese/zinc/iron transport system permease protein